MKNKKRNNNLKNRLFALSLVGAIYGTFATFRLDKNEQESPVLEMPHNIETTADNESVVKDKILSNIVYEKERVYIDKLSNNNMPKKKRNPNSYDGVFSCVMYDTNIVDENGNYLASVYQFEKVLKINSNYQNNSRLVLLDNGLTGFIDESALNDLTETFVEVDISEQMLYVYKDKECVMSTSIITGDPNIGTTPGTNIGLQEILYKSYYTSLTGPTWDVPVDYFLCFNYDGEGFHDASWREDYEYTKDTYLSNGSHGCINMRHDDVKNLDNIVSTGDKVLIHK